MPVQALARPRRPATPILVVALATQLSACAPLYRPAPPQVLFLEAQDDLNVAAHVSTGGVDGAVAYAVDDHLVVRGGAQLGGFSERGSYQRLSVGAGAYGRHGLLRYAGLLDLGGGYSRGVSSVTLFDSTVNSNLQGPFALGSGHLELGVESNYLGLGLVLRPTVQITQHDAKSDGEGTGTLLVGEAMLAFRFGSERVKAEVDAGVALPLAVQGDVGLPFPIMLGLGLVFDPDIRSQAPLSAR